MSKYNFQNFSQNKTNDNKMLIAIALGMVVLTIWNTIFPPKIDKDTAKPQSNTVKVEEKQKTAIDNDLQSKANKVSYKMNFLENENVKVGIDVNDGRIKLWQLKKYNKHNLDKKAGIANAEKNKNKKKTNNENILLLKDDNFLENGWITNVKSETQWTAKEKTSNKMIISGKIKDSASKIGLYDVEMEYLLKPDYSMEITKKIKNIDNRTNIVRGYTRISVNDTSDRIENSYAFRGIVANCNENIIEKSYDDIKSTKLVETPCDNSNWIGMSDQYWISAIISQNKINQTQGIRYNSETNRYQIDISNESKYLAKNDTLTDKVVVFLGVKNLDLLTDITNKYNIDRFEKTIDFGVFYFLSKPMLIILKKLYNISQNFGVAIILLTILVRLIIFPLANRSYKASADIKRISPKLKALQEQYKDDKKGLQMATYELYRQEKINPASAIFPMLLQIPIFFALYKVLTISIEMRDAPFLWIKDLSAKDPTSFINAFGFLPFNAPSFLQIGALPCLMGLTMFIQQKMTPSMVIDKTQKRMMDLMPVIFLLMFSGMPAGLVLYWTFSNVFTIIQQAFILKLNRKSGNNADFNDGIDTLKKKNEAIKYLERIKHKYHK